MMRLAILAAFFCAAPLSAADITAPKEEVPQHSLVRVSSVQEGTGYAWWILATDASGKLVFADVQKYDQDRSLVFTGPPGTYQIMLAVSSDGKLDQGQATVTILGAKPVPPGPAPVPPGPTPPPVPPDPPDPISPAPIKADGFRVLVLYEVRKPLPGEQNNILGSTEVRAYLGTKCAREAGGGPSFRMWDDDYDAADFAGTSTPDALRDAYLEAKSKRADDEPWIVVSQGGVGGESVPLPKTIGETLSLLRKWGG